MAKVFENSLLAGPWAATLAMALLSVSATARPTTPVPSGGTAPMPINDPASWTSIEDYPDEARVAEQEGRTVFSLELDDMGRITQCNIVESSGFPLLDSATCSAIIRNAVFRPALDAHDKPIASTWRSGMRWQLKNGAAQSE
ncbi:MAG: energy transducer TonB [Sphingomonas sp.]|jgi:TonB family protein